eukprot:10889156-Prorocentrum_lima.AAC.1
MMRPTQLDCLCAPAGGFVEKKSSLMAMLRIRHRRTPSGLAHATSNQQRWSRARQGKQQIKNKETNT